MLAIGLLTTRGVSTLDEAVHLDRADAWAGGTDTLSIDPAELWVPTAPMAGGLFYDAGDGLRSASPPGLAASAFPLVAPARLRTWLHSARICRQLRDVAHPRRHVSRSTPCWHCRCTWPS